MHENLEFDFSAQVDFAQFAQFSMTETQKEVLQPSAPDTRRHIEVAPFEGYSNWATYGVSLYLHNDSEIYQEVGKQIENKILSADSLKQIWKKMGMKLEEWMVGEIHWIELFQEQLERFGIDSASYQAVNIPEGSKIPREALIALSQATTEGNIVKLAGQLSRDQYNQVSKVLNDLGGRWNRAKGGHIFSEDPIDILDMVINTGSYSKPDKFGFFPTPPELAQFVIELANLRGGMTVLEPSAGDGKLAEKIVVIVGKGNLACVELQQKNVEVLKGKGFNVRQDDFTQIAPVPSFDRVVMNPPFERMQDIKHVLHAWQFLKPGGRLVSIMASSFTFRSNKLAEDFRAFVEKYGEVIENPAGSFKDSGTAVNTVTVVLDKPADYYEVELAEAA